MVKGTAIDQYFKISERKSTFLTELQAGFITFMTLSYILAVNANILTASGGTCEKNDDGQLEDECLTTLKKDLVIATALSSGISTLINGLWSNLPTGLAPGMGMNAYFTYTVVGFHGSGEMPYEAALTCVFIEGWLFLILAVTGLRLKVAMLIPDHIKYATTVGIGLFLAIIGLSEGEGIALVVNDPITNVTLGGCGHRGQTPTGDDGLPSYVCASQLYCSTPGCDVTGDAEFMPGDFYCGCDRPNGTEGTMSGATTWIGIVAFFLMVVLVKRGFRPAITISIILVSALSWIKGTDISWFTDDGGNKEFLYDEFKKGVGFHSIEDTAFHIGTLKGVDAWTFITTLFTFLYVDLFDTTGTLYSMVDFAGMIDKETGDFEGSLGAFSSDAIGTIVGSLLGTSPVTTYIESASGIQAGGRTGITAIVISIFFFLSCFFFPILMNIPPWATGPALLLVAVMMMKSVTKIDWTDWNQAVPSALCIMLMPFTYSIANGIIAGLAFSLLMWLTDFVFDGLQQAAPGCYACCFGPPPVDEVGDAKANPGAHVELGNGTATGDKPTGTQYA